MKKIILGLIFLIITFISASIFAKKVNVKCNCKLGKSHTVKMDDKAGEKLIRFGCEHICFFQGGVKSVEIGV